VSVDESRPDDVATDPIGTLGDSPGLTLDQLEQASGVPGRTIRFYRQTGLIESPRRSGRQAFYSEDQVARLRLIAALRARGLGLDAVSKILADPTGHLGRLEAAIAPGFTSAAATRARTDDVRRRIRTRLTALDPATPWPELVLAWLFPTSLTAVVALSMAVPSVATLDLTGQSWRPAPAEVVRSAWALMQSRIADLADQLVAVFASRALQLPRGPHRRRGRGGHHSPASHRHAAVQVAFAHEIERAIEELYVDPDEEPTRHHRHRRAEDRLTPTAVGEDGAMTDCPTLLSPGSIPCACATAS
jgi:DNA-binding transcriptional MerR regulator